MRNGELIALHTINLIRIKQTLKMHISENIKLFLRNRLYRYAFLVSQAGQDFLVFGEVFNEKKEGFFVDIGAHDGIDLSNTYLLEKRYKWSGLCIEANPISFKLLEKNRNAVCLNVCLDKQEGEVLFNQDGVMGGIVDTGMDNEGVTSNGVISLKTKTLNTVLTEASAPKVIDYLSMDIEGAEERVLDGFDFSKTIFSCISIERPSERIEELFNANDYILIKRIPGLDSFYIHKSFEDEYFRNVLSFYRKKRLSVWFG